MRKLSGGGLSFSRSGVPHHKKGNIIEIRFPRKIVLFRDSEGVEPAYPLSERLQHQKGHTRCRLITRKKYTINILARRASERP